MNHGGELHALLASYSNFKGVAFISLQQRSWVGNPSFA
jgi:hypothetical protein